MKFILVFCLIGLIAVASADDLNKKTTTDVPTSSTEPSSESPEPTPKTTPKPAPTPSPKPMPAEKLSFDIKNSTYKCALLSFIGKISIENLIENKTEMIFLTNATTIDDKFSQCHSNKTEFLLNVNGNPKQQLLLVFNQTTTSRYALGYVEYSELNIIQLINNNALISVDNKSSYYCQTNQEFKLSQNVTKPEKKAVLSLSDLKFDIFRTDKDSADFREAKQCELDFPRNDFVPLVVGAALISLVLIVLVAYIIGRKRSRRLSYQTV